MFCYLLDIEKQMEEIEKIRVKSWVRVSVDKL